MAITPGAAHRSRLAQKRFLAEGGVYAQVLAEMRDRGEMYPEGETPFQEYPKMLTLSHGWEKRKERVQTVDKEWIEKEIDVEVIEQIIVNSEEEEERVLSGGKTSAAIEQDREDLRARCVNAGIRVDPSWTAVRLRRELGETMDAPETSPNDDMAALKERLAQLEEMATMKAKIAALEAQLSGGGAPTSEVDELRATLEASDVKVDARWGVSRLRSEVEKLSVGELAAD